MGTQQVSIWVPIVVGVIGCVGIIAGQLVNAWREDRRWNLRVHQDEYERRIGRRFEVYAEMATALSKAIGLMGRLEKTHKSPEPDLTPLHADFVKTAIEIDEAMGKVRLVGSEEIIGPATDAWAEFADQADLFTDNKLYPSLDDQTLDRLFDTLHIVNQKFVDQARREFAPSTIQQRRPRLK
jgi:hypothetical protein